MSTFEVVVIAVILWWLVFFITLPFGVRPPEDPEPGFASSAPERPRLWLKAGITTVVTVVLVGALYVLVATGVVPSLRELAG